MSIRIISKEGCPYCQKARILLDALNLPYTEVILSPNEKNYIVKKNKLFTYYNRNSYPIIVIQDTVVGGYTDLIDSYNNSSLHKMCLNIGLQVMYHPS